MPSPSRTCAAPGLDRDWAFDVLRLVSALAVIVSHSPGLDQVPDWSLPLRFAVPYFCCAAVHFAFSQYGKRHPPISLREYFDDRFERVYRPFAIWTLAYVFTQLAAYWVGLADSEPTLGIELFLLGGAAHLWFIPYILLAGIAAYSVMPLASRHPGASGAAAALVALGLSAWQLWTPGRPEELPLPPQLVARSTAIFAGFSIAAWVLGLELSSSTRRLVGTIGIAFVAACSWLAVSNGGSRVMWGSVIGVSAYCACLGGWRQGWMRTVGALGPYSLGVYFAHYVFIEGYEDIARKLLGLTVDPIVNVGLVLMSIASAITVVWALARRDATRFLVR